MAKRGNNQVKNRIVNLEKYAFDEMNFIKAELEKQIKLFDEISGLKNQVTQMLKLIRLREREYKILLKRHNRFLITYNKMRAAVKGNSNA